MNSPTFFIHDDFSHVNPGVLGHGIGGVLGNVTLLGEDQRGMTVTQLAYREGPVTVRDGQGVPLVSTDVDSDARQVSLRVRGTDPHLACDDVVRAAQAEGAGGIQSTFSWTLEPRYTI